MTDSLRAKQNMEILDVFKDINSQVVGRQNKQIQAFPESLLPKTQRDLGAEVNTDKSVENINRVLETKLGALEYLVQQFASGQGVSELTKADVRQSARQASEVITNTGDVVPLWNGIVRMYQQQGLSRESQNILKVKVQELAPNLDAIVYGFNSAIDWIFRERVINSTLALLVLEFLRTVSVYNVIKTQVESGQFELLSVEQLQRQFKNALEEQPADRLAILKAYAPRGQITNTSIRNIPDFDILSRRKRLAEIADELGIDPRVFNGMRIGMMTGSEFNKYIEDIKKESRKEKAGFPLQANALIQEMEDKVSQIRALNIQNLESETKRQASERVIRDMEEKEPLAEEEVRSLTREVPEEEVIPDEPVRDDYKDDAEYEQAMEDYNDVLRQAMFSRAEREATLEYNQGLLDQAVKDKAEREQIILDRRRRIRNNIRAIEQRQRKIDDIVATFPDFERRAQEFAEGEKLKTTIRAIYNATKVKGMKTQNDAIAEEAVRREQERINAPPRRPVAPRPPIAPLRPIAPAEPVVRPPRIAVVDDEKGAVVEGEGRRAETRGLASLRKNYGFESMSDTDDSEEESESDDDRPFDFDDSRNDMYYTKPMRRK